MNEGPLSASVRVKYLFVLKHIHLRSTFSIGGFYLFAWLSLARHCNFDCSKVHTDACIGLCSSYVCAPLTELLKAHFKMLLAFQLTDSFNCFTLQKQSEGNKCSQICNNVPKREKKENHKLANQECSREAKDQKLSSRVKAKVRLSVTHKLLCKKLLSS